MDFDLSRFFKNLAERQGEELLVPGRSYEFELTEEEVIQIFGEVPEEDLAINLGFALTQVAEDDFKLVVGID